MPPFGFERRPFSPLDSFLLMTRIFAITFAFIMVVKAIKARNFNRDVQMKEYMLQQQAEMEVLSRMSSSPDMFNAIQREVRRREPQGPV